MTAIYILWLREVKRYSRSRPQIIASLAQPLLYLLVLGFGLGPVFQQAGRGSYLQFVGPGVIGMGILFTSIFSGIGLLWDRQFGFLKETLVAPVSRLTIMIGRTLGGATVALRQQDFSSHPKGRDIPSWWRRTPSVGRRPPVPRQHRDRPLLRRSRLLQLPAQVLRAHRPEDRQAGPR